MNPRNGVTQHEYGGSNFDALVEAAEENGYESEEWFTFQQAKELGASVRKGEHGVSIRYGGKWKPKEEEEGEKNRTRSFKKYYTVFNREQIDWPEEEAT